MNLKSIIFLLIFITFLFGCETKTLAPTYDFEFVLSDLMAFEESLGTSFFNESVEKPLADEKINKLLDKIDSLRKNNMRMNLSKDYDEIEIFLDSRENLLLGQQYYSVYKLNFHGRYDCDDPYNDYYSMDYLRKAGEHGVKANAKMDKLMTESEMARELILGKARPKFYDSDYGIMLEEARSFQAYLRSDCGFTDI